MTRHVVSSHSHIISRKMIKKLMTTLKYDKKGWFQTIKLGTREGKQQQCKHVREPFLPERKKMKRQAKRIQFAFHYFCLLWAGSLILEVISAGSSTLEVIHWKTNYEYRPKFSITKFVACHLWSLIENV